MNKICQSFPLFWTLPLGTTHSIPYTPGQDWTVPYFCTIVARRKTLLVPVLDPKLLEVFVLGLLLKLPGLPEFRKGSIFLTSERRAHMDDFTLFLMLVSVMRVQLKWFYIGCHEKFKFCVLGKEKILNEFDLWTSTWCKVCIQVCISPGFLLPYK